MESSVHFGLSLAARLTLLAPFFQVILASSEVSPLRLFGTDSLDARDPFLKKRAWEYFNAVGWNENVTV